MGDLKTTMLGKYHTGTHIAGLEAEIARLRADLAEARDVVKHFLANRGGIVVSSYHEMALETEMMRRARALIGRGA